MILVSGVCRYLYAHTRKHKGIHSRALLPPTTILLVAEVLTMGAFRQLGFGSFLVMVVEFIRYCEHMAEQDPDSRGYTRRDRIVIVGQLVDSKKIKDQLRT